MPNQAQTFDPKAYLKKEEENRKKMEKFDPKAYLAKEKAEPPREAAVEEPKPEFDLEEVPTGKILESVPVADEMLQSIADKYGIGVNVLKQAAPIYGVYTQELQDRKLTDPEGWYQAATTVVGKGLRGLTGGAVQKAFRQNLPEQHQKALDELYQVAGKTQSRLFDALEIVWPVGVASKLSKATKVAAKAKEVGKVSAQQLARKAALKEGAKQVAASAALGGLFGYGQSRAGEEIESTLLGVGVGAAAIPTVRLIGKGASKLKVPESFKRKAAKETLLRLKRSTPALETKAEAYVNEIRPELERTKELFARPGLNLDNFEAYASKFKKLPRLLDKHENEIYGSLASSEAKLIADSLRDKVGTRLWDTLNPEERINAVKDYASYLKLKDWQALLEKVEGRSLEKLRTTSTKEKFSQQIEGAIRTDKMKKELVHLSKRKRLPEIQRLEWLLRKMGDGRQVMRLISNKYGVDGVSTVDTLGDKLELHKLGLDTDTNNIHSILGKMIKDKVDPEKLMDMAERRIPTEEKYISHMKKVGKLVKEMRKEAQAHGTEIPKLQEAGMGYIPNLRLQGVSLANAFREQLKKLGINDSRDLTPEIWNKLSSDKLMKQIIDQVKSIADVKKINNVNDFKKHLDDIYLDVPSIESGTRMSAFALEHRTGELPDWIRDKNLPNVLFRYASQTLKYARIREEMAKLSSIAEVLDEAADPSYARYVRNIIQDTMGTRPGTHAARVMKKREKWAKKIEAAALKAEERGEKALATLYRASSDAPMLQEALARNVYGNLLGANPASAFQNLASAYFQNIPEIGLVRGHKYIAQAIFDVGDTLAFGKEIKLSPEMARKMGREFGEVIKTRNPLRILHNEGLIGPGFNADYIEAFQKGIEASPVKKLSKKAIKTITHTFMGPFMVSELAARELTRSVSRGVAADMIKNPKFRQQMIKKIESQDYRRLLRKAFAEGNEEKINSIMTRYFNANNMFQYNRATMFEAGRNLGPLLSTFMKWPTSIGGRILTNYLVENPSKATDQTLKKLILPYIAAKLAWNYGVDESIREDPYVKKLIRDPSQAVALASVVDKTARGSFIQTPAIGAAIEAARLGEKGLKGDIEVEDVLKALDRGIVRPFGPLDVFFRFFGEDLRFYLYGEERSKEPFARYPKAIETITGN